LARKKNLTREDLEDVSTYESQLYTTQNNGSNNIRLQDTKLDIKCLNEKQKKLRRSIEEKDVVISTGPAGTGRTYMSLLTALHLMKTQPKYRKLVLVKSLQVIKGEELGFLPGNLWDKMEPYMFSFTGNLDKIFHNPSITKGLIDKGVIEVFPITYIRGVTMDNCIVIVDEAQNLSMHTFRTIITRIGRNCKMVFLGDTEQVDLKDKNTSCLVRVAELFENQEYAGSVVFEDEDSVRNPIIPELLKLLKGEE
jgi:phosphate starvation-inducible protein PhoH and related proteins